MEKNIEIEFKTLIDKKTYYYLINKFKLKKQRFKQTNYYFDTNNFDLLNNLKVLRIREKNKNYKITLKVSKTNYIEEFHCPITKDDFNNLIKKGFVTNNYFKQIDYFVNYQQKLTTFRAKYQYLDGYLFFDKSIYKDAVDYEIEYEANNYEEGSNVFNNFLKENNIKYLKPDSKSVRALKN